MRYKMVYLAFCVSLAVLTFEFVKTYYISFSADIVHKHELVETSKELEIRKTKNFYILLYTSFITHVFTTHFLLQQHWRDR